MNLTLSKKSLILISIIIGQVSLTTWAKTVQNTDSQLKSNHPVVASHSKSTHVPVSNSIIITEYVEGSSSNKALEISNVGTFPVDLGADNYKLALYPNGSIEEYVPYQVLLTGILNPGRSFVVYNANANAEFKFPYQGAESDLALFNGDDAIVLSKNGVAVDSFGRVGEDPGSEWLDLNNANFSSKNKTLRRLNSVTVGDSVVDDAFPGASNQWLAFNIDTSDGLGCPGENICPPEVNYNVIRVKNKKILVLPTQ